MKKLLFVLLFIPLISFGQEEKTINLNVKKGKVDDTGVTYLGNGKYSMKTAALLYASSRSITKKVIKQVVDFANNLDANYKILNNSVSKGGGKKRGVSIFELRTKLGNNLIINKEEAKKEIISLKEFLDLGIITQDEFNKKAVYLKKILLGN